MFAPLGLRADAHTPREARQLSSDCLETLEEIDGEIRESFLDAGGEEFTYIPCLNDSADHIDMIETMVEQEAAGWL